MIERAPGGSMVKNLPASERRCRRHEFNSCFGKIPWNRKWQTAAVFLPGKFYGREAWHVTVCRVGKLDTTEQLSTYLQQWLKQWLSPKFHPATVKAHTERRPQEAVRLWNLGRKVAFKGQGSSSGNIPALASIQWGVDSSLYTPVHPPLLHPQLLLFLESL